MPRTVPPWEIKREVYIKTRTQPTLYGHKPSERPEEEYIKNGVINLDKPADQPATKSRLGQKS